MKRLLTFLLIAALWASACVAPVAPHGTSERRRRREPFRRGGRPARRNHVTRHDPHLDRSKLCARRAFWTRAAIFGGFDVDVANEIAKRLGVEVEFVTPDWDLITAGNWGDQWDMSVGSMTVTTARQEILDFASPPYYYTPAQFAAVDGSGFETLEDLNGASICVGVSTTYESWLMGDMESLGLPAASFYVDAPPADTSIIPLTVDNDCAQQIQAGRHEFQAFLTSNTVVEAAIAQGVPIHKVGTPVFSRKSCSCVRQERFQGSHRIGRESQRNHRGHAC